MKGPSMHWLEQVVGLALIAGTRDICRKIDGWFYLWGRYVCGCEWPDGIWSAIP